MVIGSGLGGLACAAYPSAAGRRTWVLEAHYVAGGNSQTFRRGIGGRNYEFDIGVHYIGECGPEGLITRVLRGVGLDGGIAPIRALGPGAAGRSRPGARGHSAHRSMRMLTDRSVTQASKNSPETISRRARPSPASGGPLREP